jgi:hypothetical protein
MQRIAWCLVVLLLATTLALAWTPAARAFSVSLANTYGFQASGWDLISDSSCPTPNCPLSASGVFTLDSFGDVTAADVTIIDNGHFACYHAKLLKPATATYSTNSDGTGTMLFILSSSGCSEPHLRFMEFNFAISDGGNILEFSIGGDDFAPTDTVLSGVARKRGSYN